VTDFCDDDLSNPDDPLCEEDTPDSAFFWNFLIVSNGRAAYQVHGARAMRNKVLCAVFDRVVELLPAAIQVMIYDWDNETWRPDDDWKRHGH